MCSAKKILGTIITMTKLDRCVIWFSKSNSSITEIVVSSITETMILLLGVSSKDTYDAKKQGKMLPHMT